MTTFTKITLIAATVLLPSGIASPLSAGSGELHRCFMPAARLAAPAQLLGLAVSTGDATARALFGAGLTAYWSGDAATALHAFRAAQAADPSCAMCHWGEALALGPRPNAAMPSVHVRPAWEAIIRAEGLARGASALERDLIAALRHRYGVNPMVLQDSLDLAWATAIKVVEETHPSVDVVKLLAGEAQAILRSHRIDGQG